VAELETPGRFIATIPYSLGYEPSDDNLIAIPLAEDGTVKQIAVLKWTDDPEIAFRLSDGLSEAHRQVGAQRYVLVGYGPEGGMRAQRLDNLLVTTHKADASVLVHVENGIMSAKMPGERDWSPREPLPDVAAEHALAGHVTPAASLEEMARRYEPLEKPLFATLSGDAALALDALSPALRAEVAVRALNQLAQPQSDDIDKMATLAHLISTAEPTVRDVILVDATRSEATAEILAATFRAAPPQQREAIAPIAAGAMYMTGYPQQAVAKVLEQASPSGPNARLGELLKLSMQAGIPPATMRSGLPTDKVHAALEEADKTWHDVHADSSRRAASFPSPATARVEGANASSRGTLPRETSKDRGHEM